MMITKEQLDKVHTKQQQAKCRKIKKRVNALVLRGYGYGAIPRVASELGVKEGAVRLALIIANESPR